LQFVPRSTSNPSQLNTWRSQTYRHIYFCLYYNYMFYDYIYNFPLSFDPHGIIFVHKENGCNKYIRVKSNLTWNKNIIFCMCENLLTLVKLHHEIKFMNSKSYMKLQHGWSWFCTHGWSCVTYTHTEMNLWILLNWIHFSVWFINTKRNSVWCQINRKL